MRTSQGTAELSKALSAAQGEFPEIGKDKSVTVRTDKGQYTFKYAELSSIIEATKKAMAKHGLSIMSAPAASTEGLVLTTRLSHSSGEWVEGDFPLKTTETYTDRDGKTATKQMRPQDLGAQLTYFRRYAVTGLLHIATDDDVDGGGDIAEHGPAKQPATRTAENPTRIIRKPAPDPEKDDSTPNVLGKVTNLAQKINKANIPFIEILMKQDDGKEERIILKKSPENKAQQDAIDMIERDLSAAMMAKQYVEVMYSMTGPNKMYAGMKVHKTGEEPKL